MPLKLHNYLYNIQAMKFSSMRFLLEKGRFKIDLSTRSLSRLIIETQKMLPMINFLFT